MCGSSAQSPRRSCVSSRNQSGIKGLFMSKRTCLFDAAVAGGGDWNQYRHDPRGGSENPGVFAAAEAAKLSQLWALELGPYVYTQAVLSGDLAVYTTASSGKVVAVDANTGSVRWSRAL